MAFKELGVELALRMSGFRAGLGAAAADVKAFGGDVAKVGDASNKDFAKVGQSALIMGGGLLAGFGIAANAAMGFEKELSNLQGVSGATGEQMGKLKEQALAAGAATVFSAGQAVEAQTELAKAGVSTADILGGALTGALNLAAAGGLSLADAATIAANAMTTFKLQGSDVTDIADTLAAGANKSAGDVDGMAMSLQQSGLVAAQFGLDLQETVGVLSLFAQNGLKGSDAGTSFKTMLQRLVPSSAEAKEMMETLGIKVFDASGNFIGIAAAAQEYQDALAPLTQEQRANALQTIFGSDAVRAGAILYQAGAKGVEEWTGKVTDSGYAADLAATKMDNLAGDVENLKGSIETALITGGSNATGVLRGLTQAANDVVLGFIALPDVLQGVGVGIAGIGGVSLTTLGAVSSLVPKVKEAREALEGMGKMGHAANVGMGAFGKGLALATPGLIAGITLLGNIEQAGKDAVAAITKDFKTPTTYTEIAGQVNILIGEYERLKDVGSGSDFASFGQNINPFQDNVIEDAQAGARELEKLIDEQQANLGRWRDASMQVQSALGLTSDEVDALAQKAGIDLTGAIDLTVPAMVAAWNEMRTGTGESRNLGGAMDELTGKVATVEEKLKAMDDAMKGIIDTAFGLENANDAIWRGLNRLPGAIQAIADEATTTGSTFQDTMDGNSDAAIGLRDVMRDLVDKSKDVISEYAQQGIQGDELNTKMRGLKETILEQAVALGVPREEAGKYLDVLDQFPPSQEVEFSNNAVDMKTLVEEYGTSIYLLPNEKRTEIQALIDQGKIVEARAVLDELSRPRSTTVSITANYSGLQTRSGVPYYLAPPGTPFSEFVTSGGVPAYLAWGQRWGGVMNSYAGGGIEAHVARGTIVRYAEPETGGEAFVPRLGKYDRSMAVLDKAAGWYGAKVVPMAAGGVIRPSADYMTASGRETRVIEIHAAPVVNAYGGLTPMQRAQTQRMVAEAVRSGIHDVVGAGGI